MSKKVILITGASSGFGALTARGVDLRAVELDVNFQDSVDAGAAQILGEHGRIDVLVHNAGHMVVGPAEAFTPEQLADLLTAAK